MRLVRMPMEAAIARFCVTARISSPKRVKRNRASKPMKMSKVKTMIHSRLYVTVIRPRSNDPLIHEGLPTSLLVGPKTVRTPCCRISDSPQVASSVSSGRP